MTLPDRSEILAREERFRRPAGIAAVVGAILVLIAPFVRDTAVSGDDTAERLLDAASGNGDAQLYIGSILAAIAYLLLAAPLTLLFTAARDRSERVQGRFKWLIAVGAVLLAGGLVANSFAYLNAADDFAASEAERGAAAPAAPGSDTTVLAQNETTLETTTTNPGDATETGGGDSTTSTTADEGDEEEDAEDRAEDALREASGAAISLGLALAGILAFAIGFFYTSLWAMRTGLLTRFWGSLGMACAVVFVLFGTPLTPPSPILLFQEVWFMALGFILLGLWVGGRPPAWDAGIAIPWLKPGEEPPAEDSDPNLIEGEGREVTGDDPDGTDGAPDASPPSSPPRKRKRRN